jgi:hypothetical protein
VRQPAVRWSSAGIFLLGMGTVLVLQERGMLARMRAQAIAAAAMEAERAQLQPVSAGRHSPRPQRPTRTSQCVQIHGLDMISRRIIGVSAQSEWKSPGPRRPRLDHGAVDRPVGSQDAAWSGVQASNGTLTSFWYS